MRVKPYIRRIACLALAVSFSLNCMFEDEANCDSSICLSDEVNAKKGANEDGNDQGEDEDGDDQGEDEDGDDQGEDEDGDDQGEDED